ncbi:MAG: Tyrosine recombinase XerD, partial [uncultured Thermomicrobiales bacterium]
QPAHRPDGLPACPGGLGPGQARAYAHPAAQLRHPPARIRHRPADHPGAAGAPQLQHHRPLPPRHHGGAEVDPQPVRRARDRSRKRGPAM